MRIPRRKSLVIAFFLVLTTPNVATSQVNPFLARLEGSWQGEGKAFGMPTKMQMQWEWVLVEKFLRLTLETDTGRPNPRLFQGRAYYKAIGADKFEAHWFDSRGESFPIKAHLEGNALVALWGSPDKEEGKSIYRLVDDSTLEVVDLVKQKGGTYREFGRVTLKRN